MRGETNCNHFMMICGRNFNPLPSCEGRPYPVKSVNRAETFQSTPLMRGETSLNLVPNIIGSNFNPLPSCEGRQDGVVHYHKTEYISIHSPHARGDVIYAPETSDANDFNPLPSCEGRLRAFHDFAIYITFQSTPLMRGETAQTSKNPFGFKAVYTTKTSQLIFLRL